MIVRKKKEKKKALECFEEAVRAREALGEEHEEDRKVEVTPIVYLPEPVWVPPQRIHPSAMAHNNFCEVCNKLEPLSIGKAILKCIYCNVIAHVQCLKKRQKNFEIHSSKRNWVCFYCVDALKNSKETYDHAVDVAAKFRRRNEAQIIIAKYFRRYSARKHYVAVYTVIIMLQIQFRVRRRKLQFFMQRQSKIRAIRLKIYACTDLFPADRLNSLINGGGSSPMKRKDNYFYVIVTVLEMLPYGTKQNWKVYSDLVYAPHTKHGLQHVTFDCNLLLPGCSGFNTICLTIFQKGNSRDLFLGQTHVFLGENHIWKRGGQFETTLGDQQYCIMDHIGLELKSEYRFQPCGSIKFDVITSFKMHTECGSVYATPIEELLRVLNQMPTFDGYVQPATNTNILSKRKGLQSSSSSAPSLANVPMKRMWLVLMEGMAYVYPHFGGPLKLIINLEWFTSGTSMKDRNIVFKLHHQSYPEFRFSAVGSEDLLRWKCAYICCMRYKQFRDKFEMRQLIDEMIKMDAYHARRYPHRNMSYQTVGSNSTAGHTTGGSFAIVNRTPVALVPTVHLNSASSAAAVAAGNDNTISSALLSRVKGLALRAKEELRKDEPEEDEFEINYSYKSKKASVIDTGAGGLNGSSSEPKLNIASAALRAQILKKKKQQHLQVETAGTEGLTLKLPPLSPVKQTSSGTSAQTSARSHTTTSTTTSSNNINTTSTQSIVDVIREVALKEQLKDQLQEEIREEYEVDDAIINENVMMIGMNLTEQMLLKGAKKKLKRKRNKPKRNIRKSLFAAPQF